MHISGSSILLIFLVVLTAAILLVLHLTKIGRKAFATHHGRLKASLLLSEKIDGKTILSTKTIKIVPAKHKHKK